MDLLITIHKATCAVKFFRFFPIIKEIEIVTSEFFSFLDISQCISFLKLSANRIKLFLVFNKKCVGLTGMVHVAAKTRKISITIILDSMLLVANVLHSSNDHPYLVSFLRNMHAAS